MAKPRVPPPLIQSHLIAAFGAVTDFQPVSEGEDSQAFGFVRGRDRYIARINASAAGFRKDDFVSRRFAGMHLPIPDVIAIDRLPTGHACCVSRRAPGVTLQDLAARDLATVLEPVAGVLDAMADCDLRGTRGFGTFDDSGIGGFARWRDYLTGIRDHDRYDWPAAYRHVARDRIERLFEPMTALLDHCPEQRHLVHGDFGSNNVLADGGRISGVIDWSDALFGDPLYDIANILFWRSWLMCMEQQARFFEQRQPDRLASTARLRCYQLRIGLNVLYDAAIDRNDDEIAWALARCDAIAAQS